MHTEYDQFLVERGGGGHPQGNSHTEITLIFLQTFNALFYTSASNIYVSINELNTEGRIKMLEQKIIGMPLTQPPASDSLDKYLYNV